jgi:hypothetical protein|tara:strand:+ start:2945 stop:4048 length:1104 start_codon:yes stop_codon:yes gene_type:complete
VNELFVVVSFFCTNEELKNTRVLLSVLFNKRGRRRKQEENTINKMLASNATTLNNGDASNGGRKNYGFFASGSSILPRRKSFDGMNKKSSKGGGRSRAIFSPPPPSSSSSSSVLVFPEQEDEAYPYLSRRRISESEGGKFVRRNISSSALYEHELQLKDDGVVEYAVRRRIETTIETSGGGKDVLNAVYSRLQEGILGGSNTMDDSIRSREASAKEVREFMFGSDETLETRRSKGPPLYQTLDNHRAKTFHVCETKSQSAFGKSIMKTFVSSDRSTGSIAFKMIENSRVFEVYEGSNAIEIASDGSIYIVARGKAKMKGLLKKFAHKQVANVLVSKIRANLERTRDAIDGGANTANNNNNGDAALFA